MHHTRYLYVGPLCVSVYDSRVCMFKYYKYVLWYTGRSEREQEEMARMSAVTDCFGERHNYFMTPLICKVRCNI
jgi:hypothetical protein